LDEDCRQVVEGVEFLFHCAANTQGAGVRQNPMAHVTPNVVINTQLLDAAFNAGVSKVLWLSSTSGYSFRGEEVLKEGQFMDGEPFEKYYFAAWMKRFTEILC
jgi:GDP-L-fucose synthase